MKLQEAERIAMTVLDSLRPFCSRIEVAGSIRRRRPDPHDIDIVLIPKDPWKLDMTIRCLGNTPVTGGKLQRLILPPAASGEPGTQVDIYFATPQTWATLLLIRTGSKESNIRLCWLAKQRGWHLAANGDGMFDAQGRRIAGDTERSIFAALGELWLEPEERD